MKVLISIHLLPIIQSVIIAANFISLHTMPAGSCRLTWIGAVKWAYCLLLNTMAYNDKYWGTKVCSSAVQTMIQLWLQQSNICRSVLADAAYQHSITRQTEILTARLCGSVVSEQWRVAHRVTSADRFTTNVILNSHSIKMIQCNIPILTSCELIASLISLPHKANATRNKSIIPWRTMHTGRI